MWRVALSMIAIFVDAAILLLTGLGLSQVQVRVDLPSAAQAPTPAGITPGGMALMVTLLFVFGLNILAILFGARIKPPGSRRKAAAEVFE